MLASLRSSVASLVRDRGLIIWALLFPIVMSCIFMGMFAGVEDGYASVSTRLGVVRDDAFAASYGLDETLDGIASDEGDDGSDALVTLVDYDSADEAEQAAAAGEIDAYLTVDEAAATEGGGTSATAAAAGEEADGTGTVGGTLRLHVSPAATAERGTLPVSVLRQVLEVYVHLRDAMGELASTDLQLVLSGDALSAFRAGAVATTRVQATKAEPSPTARYYYALLAMACGLGVMFSLKAIQQLMPPSSPLGARQALAAVPRWRMLLGALLGSWLCELACMLVAMLFMWGVAGVGFGNAPWAAVLAVALSCLMACAAGALLGTVPRMQLGMVSGITCALSFFTGLYGPASQEFADAFEEAAPVLAQANPLWQTTNCFYALLYYDTPDAFVGRCLALAGMAALFFALAAARMRRTSYDHL